MFQVLLPVCFGGIEVQLLFVGKGAQRIEFRIGWLGMDRFTQRGNALRRRPPHSHRAAGQHHHTEKGVVRQRMRLDVLHPFGQRRMSKKSRAGHGNGNAERNRKGAHKTLATLHENNPLQRRIPKQVLAATGGLQFAPPACWCCAQYPRHLPSGDICRAGCLRGRLAFRCRRLSPDSNADWQRPCLQDWR